ncbi:uncharacterized protein LOC119663132 [Teleopsis dalmanni]|uniref:uncharacterized protein LOC119663132 n=1 Tax=Teleopsis dalmanni TaxID=139649 RepID=UPI0018CD760C|nr:uncharacterized protein LOC119663132 [Teleopsis dalmanni]
MSKLHKSLPSRIDIIIGSDLIPEISQTKIRKINGLILQETSLGWVVSGNIERTAAKNITTASATVDIADLERFWEIEEEAEDISKENERCEEHFKTNTKRTEDGKFTVAIPFKDDKQLGNSRKLATARLLSMERKFIQNPSLKEEYSKFMKEYLNLGHMKPANSFNKGKY